MSETYRRNEESRPLVRPAADTFGMVDADGKVSVQAAVDRVRWSAVLAGLFTTLATLIVLAVLGIAIGLSAYDPNTTAQNFGIGAGLYGAISAIIAFFLGGFIAARTAAVAGSGNGILNGAMVWLVTIPLIVNLLGTGINSLLGTATDLAGDAAVAAGNAVGGAAGAAGEALAQNPNIAQTAVGAAQQGATAVATGVQGAADPNATAVPGQDPVADAAAGAQAAIQDAQTQLQNVDEQDVDRVAQDVGNIAWGTLAALGLSALASILGGLLGKRNHPTDIAILDHGHDRDRRAEAR